MEYKPPDTSKKVEPTSKPFNQISFDLPVIPTYEHSRSKDCSRKPKVQARYAYIFDYPEHCREAMPVSLHDVIASTSSVDFSLEAHFKVAPTIAKCIWTLHTDERVHKAFVHKTWSSSAKITTRFVRRALLG